MHINVRTKIYKNYISGPDSNLAYETHSFNQSEPHMKYFFVQILCILCISNAFSIRTFYRNGWVGDDMPGSEAGIRGLKC